MSHTVRKKYHITTPHKTQETHQQMQERKKMNKIKGIEGSLPFPVKKIDDR